MTLTTFDVVMTGLAFLVVVVDSIERAVESRGFWRVFRFSAAVGWSIGGYHIVAFLWAAR